MLTRRMSRRGTASTLVACTACLASVALALTFAPTPKAATGEVLLPDCGNVLYGGKVAPVTWSSGCLGGSVNLDQLSWQGWGGPVASATGIVHYNDCEPSCAAGSISDYPAELRVEQVQRCASPLGPHSYYTLFTVVITYPPENEAGQPPGPSNPFTFPSTCPTPGYLVKPRSKVATFGAFAESGSYDGDRLESYFGPPSKRKREGLLSCVKHWRHIGLTVTVGSIELDEDPCYSGRFIMAILRGSRWHLPSGVRPGAPARKAAAEAARPCSIRICRTNGYVLSQHHSDCAARRVPSVIADTGGGRVRRLLVLSHFCE
jgi:hypothetical protein